MRYGWLWVMCVCGVAACGEPEAHVVYQRGQEPTVIPRGTVVGPGVTPDQGTVIPDSGTTNPNPNPNPTETWPVAPSMLGPTTPISSTPCTLDNRLIFADNGGVYFSDGVLRCTVPADSTNVSLNWKHSSSTSMYMRIGGASGAWMNVGGTLNPADILPSYYADLVPVPGGSTVDLYIENSAMLTDFFIGFNDPASEEEGG